MNSGIRVALRIGSSRLSYLGARLSLILRNLTRTLWSLSVPHSLATVTAGARL